MDSITIVIVQFQIWIFPRFYCWNDTRVQRASITFETIFTNNLQFHLVRVRSERNPECSSQTKVGQFNAPLAVDEQVLGFQIAVKNSVAVTKRQTIEKLTHITLSNIFIKSVAIAEWRMQNYDKHRPYFNHPVWRTTLVGCSCLDHILNSYWFIYRGQSPLKRPSSISSTSHNHGLK